jgi:molecular chaperone HscA
MPAGMPRVQVQFQIDANGILSVTARELRTEIEQTIEVKPSYGLTDEKSSGCCSIVRARRGRLRRAPADRGAQRGRVGDSGHREVAALAGVRRDRDDRVSRRRAQKIESVLAGLKMVLKSTDRETIQKWTHALNDATQHLAEVMMNRSVQRALPEERRRRLERS